MNCPSCSHHFCWICLKQWSGHSDYYNCKFVLPENVRNREVISGYAEVYLKYKDYDGNRKSYLQGREAVKAKFEALRNAGSTTRTNNFLLEAVEELAMCYHTLANSYVLYHYNDFTSPHENVCPGVSKELFEYNQRNLEAMTNKLSCKYDKEVKPMTEYNSSVVDELMRLTSIVHDYRRKLFAVDNE
jgi:ariadne-1